MNKSHKLDDHILVNWVSDNPNDEYYEFFITKHNKTGMGKGRYAQGSVGCTSTYKEFLNGSFHDFVIEHFSKQDLFEAITIVKMIEAAKEVHRLLGPGLKDTAYKEALNCEITARGVQVTKKHAVPIVYKERPLGIDLELDFLVEGFLIINIKAQDSLSGLDQTELKTSLRLSKKRFGLLLNFNVQELPSAMQCIIDEYPDKN